MTSLMAGLITIRGTIFHVEIHSTLLNKSAFQEDAYRPLFTIWGEGSLCTVVSVWGVSVPGLCPGVSVQGVSVQGVSVQGFSVQGGLCQGVVREGSNMGPETETPVNRMTDKRV